MRLGSGRPLGFAPDGKSVLVTPAREADRIEVVLRIPGKGVAGGAGLLHLDVRSTGRLGYSYADPKIKRQDLIPGASCLAKR